MKKVMILVVSAVVIIAGGYFTMEYLNQKKKRKVLEGTRGTSRKIHSLQYSRCTINYVYKI